MLISGEVTLNGKDLVLKTYTVNKLIEKNHTKVAIFGGESLEIGN